MKTLVITEGKLNHILLKHLLQTDPPQAKFEVLSAGGQGSAISLARTYLVKTDHRVALVLDADANDPDQLQEKQEMVSDLLESVAARHRFFLLLIVPETESLLFTDRHRAELLFGKSLTEQEWAEAKYEPKIALGRMIQGTGTRIINLSKFEKLLQAHDLRPFARAQPVQDLRRFIAASRISRKEGVTGLTEAPL